MNKLSYEDLIEKFVCYAEQHEGVRAAFVIGSRARRESPADEWSDLDVVLLTNEPEYFLYETEWLNQIHSYSITLLEKAAVSEALERRVLFNPDLDVDFIVVPTNAFKDLLSSQEVLSVFNRGVRVLIDKDDAIKLLPKANPVSPSHTIMMDEKQFDQIVQDFWYHSIWTMKKILRGELWTAKMCLDNGLKTLLLSICESQASIVYGRDTWHKGRFIERWADDRVITRLGNIFSHYDRDDMIRALQATMDLFRELSVELSSKLEYSYPESADQAATRFFETHLLKTV